MERSPSPIHSQLWRPIKSPVTNPMSVLIRTLVGSLEVVANLGSANRLTVRSLTLLKKNIKKR
jgi:hypothetical protein